MNEWLEFISILMIGGCIIWWIVIWIRACIFRISGRCPKSRICRDSLCKNKIWCRKYRRYTDVYERNYESMREMRQKKTKKKQP